MRRLLTCLVALAAGPAFAQVTVRGGEHDGFTRLVLALPVPGVTWQVEPRDEGWRITVPDVEAFDLGEVWDRIGRDHVAAVVAEDGGLLLLAGCECDLAATEFPGGLLALDVGPTVATERRPEPADPSPGPLPRVGAPPVSLTGEEGILPLLPQSAPAIETPRRTPAPAPPPLGPVRPRDELRLALAGALSAGVDSGLLRPAADPPEGAAPAVPLSSDATIVLDAGDAPAPAGPADCPDSLHLSFEAGSLGPLYGEFDRLSPRAALAHARLALSQGLFPEARAHLALLDDPGPVGRTLTAMAQAGDGADPGWTGCPPEAEVWSAALGEAPEGRGTDLSNAVRALPAGLRDALGPRAAETLARRDEAGDVAAARSILSALGPAAQQTASALVAEALLSDGDDRLALLRRAVGTADVDAPRAALALLRAEGGIDARSLDRIAALVVDRPDHPLVPRIAERATAAALEAERPDLAIELADPGGEPAWAAVASYLRSAEGAAFVRLVHEHGSALAGAPLSAEDREAIERRLARAWPQDGGRRGAGDLPPAPAPLAWRPEPAPSAAVADAPLVRARDALVAAGRASDLVSALGPEE